MAILNLSCVRQKGAVVIRWNWDGNDARATITITRLLDGEKLLERAVTGILYQNAINSAAHGFELQVPDEPVCVTVSDGDSEVRQELLTPKYVVRWRIEYKNIYKRTLFRTECIGREYCLRMDFPCTSAVPEDLFCYAPANAGENAPAGHLPGLKHGSNLFGVIPQHGEAVVLYCNPEYENYCRLFQMERLPDMEIKE